MQHLYQTIFARQLPWHLGIFLILFFDATGLAAPIPTDQPNSSKTLKVHVSSTDEQIRNRLLEITPIGTPLEQALKFASSEGKKHGMPTEITVGPAAHRQFALSGDYPVLYGFLYYHLFANYLFDSQDRLVDLRAWIGLGATTPAMWLPIDLLLGSCFLIALLLLRVYKRLRIRLLRFYSWIICVSFAAWAATDISWRATGSIWMPSLRPLEYLFLVTYLPVGMMLLILWFLAGNSVIAFSFYLKPSGRKGAADRILGTLLAVLSDGYFVWWLLFKNQGWT
jgi:hypothetical protein